MTIITQINILIDLHDDYANCPGCSLCDRINELSAPWQIDRPKPKPKQHNITKEQFERAKENGVGRTTLKDRVLVQKMDIEEAIAKPVRDLAFTQEQRDTAKANGISMSILSKRVNSGWDIEKAMTKKPRKKKGNGGSKEKQYEAG